MAASTKSIQRSNKCTIGNDGLSNSQMHDSVTSAADKVVLADFLAAADSRILEALENQSREP